MSDTAAKETAAKDTSAKQAAARDESSKSSWLHKLLARLKGEATAPAVYVFLLIAVVTTWLLLPRPVLSSTLVLPRVDHGFLAELDRAERDLARAALKDGLSIQARTVGELLRRSGLAMASGDSNGARRRLDELRREVLILHSAGRVDELVKLRALQGQLFLEALGQYVPGADPGVELQELGGDFVKRAGRRFFDREGRLRLDRSELLLLFRIRWARMAGAESLTKLAPSLTEKRAYYSLFLRFPLANEVDVRERALERVALCRALGKVDPSFPVQVAEGFLFAQAGELGIAERKLQRYLAHQPDGPYWLSARNALLYARSRQ